MHQITLNSLHLFLLCLSLEVCLCARALLWPFPWHYGKAGLVVVVYAECSFALFQLQEGRLWPGQEPGPSVLFLELSCPVCVTLALIQQGSHHPGFRDCQTSGEIWTGWGLELGMGKTTAMCLTLGVGCNWSSTAGMASPRDTCHATSFRVQQLSLHTGGNKTSCILHLLPRAGVCHLRWGYVVTPKSFSKYVLIPFLSKHPPAPHSHHAHVQRHWSIL